MVDESVAEEAWGGLGGKVLRHFIPRWRLAFAPPAWALFFEVPDATGFAKSRSADAIAMSIWPSRGLELHGFEFKHSRSDWLVELKHPEKAERIARYCDFWYLVTSEEGVATLEEIPPSWGWMVQRGTRIVTKKEASKLEPLPVDRPFLAALLRRKSESLLVMPEVAGAIEKAKKDTEDRMKTREEFELKTARREVFALKQVIERCEAVAGVKLNEWNAQEVGAAIKAVMECGALRQRAKDLLKPAQEVLDTLKRQLHTTECDVKALEVVLAETQKQAVEEIK